ncbi:MAG TPA: sigma-54 dependent transcriptional regulator [Burkholderiales bacterium]
MTSMHVLVVDDEAATRQILAETVSNAGYSVDSAADMAEAAAKLARGDVDVVLCDIQLPDGSGIDLLRRSRESGSDTNFVMVTAYASVETAVEALRAGAFDYIIKPVRHQEILHRLGQIANMRDLREENRTLRKAVLDGRPLYAFTSPGMREVERLIQRVAPTDSTVMLVGESGTGKGVLARAIHEQSARRDGLFVGVNCGAIPAQLMESEFFGYTKGAFTGADHSRKGLFLEADKGTLFLDEIGELPLHMQTKLLDVIEDKEVRPLGGGAMRRTDARIVVATNRDLAEMVSQGQFRQDLYFRLSVFRIQIPPLREAPEDIRGLIAFVLRANATIRGAAQAFELDPYAEQILLSYSWPGNVRELENVIKRACILAEGNCISIDEIPSEIVKATMPLLDSANAVMRGESLRDRVRQFEAEHILRAIDDAGGDRKLAAQMLGISLSSLYGKLSGAQKQ